MARYNQYPLVSIIVPMFNAELYIKEALDSIFNQTYQNIEIIAVDDGSTDGTSRIVKEYSERDNRCKYIYLHNSGVSTARNNGILHATGEFITFFDADDIMLPHKIAVQVGFLINHPDLSIVLTDYHNFTHHGDYEQTHFMTCPQLSKLINIGPQKESIVIEPAKARSILAVENFTIADSPLLRREVITQVGMFDTNLKACEDFEFTYRIATKYQIGVLNCVGFKRRVHSTNMSNISHNTLPMLQNYIKSRSKLLKAEQNDDIRNRLKLSLSNYHLGLSEYYIGIDNSNAFKETIKSFFISPRILLQSKKMIKIILSAMGLYKKR